jgi:hypothetical protein
MKAGSEGRRALFATALGVALGALVALFQRRDARAREESTGGRAWRGRSET